jgi:hypothetical protein
MTPLRTYPRLAGLSPTELLQGISVKKAADLNDLSVDTFERRFPHLIRKITPRRRIVRLGDALTLPPPP